MRQSHSRDIDALQRAGCDKEVTVSGGAGGVTSGGGGGGGGVSGRGEGKILDRLPNVRDQG